MDGVPPGDKTGCSLSVIVPCHMSLGNQHSITVIDDHGVVLSSSGSFVFLSELTVWFV